jgi:hypothetical protein
VSGRRAGEWPWCHSAVPADCTDYDEAVWHILRAWPSDPDRLPVHSKDEWVARMRASRAREGVE